MATCIRCGTEIPSSAARCPGCQAPDRSAPAGTWSAGEDIAGDPNRPVSSSPPPPAAPTRAAAGRGATLAAAALPHVAEAAQSAEETGRRPRLWPAEVVELPRVAAPEPSADSTPAAPSPADASASSSTARRPPVLASEILREQMEPSCPGEQELRRLTVAVGLIGTALSLAVGTASSLSFGVGLACALLAALGLAPLSYPLRASVLFGAGVAAATLAASFHPRSSGSELSLAFMVIALGAALRMRSYFRASKIARVLVGLSVAALVAWLVASGAARAFFDLTPRWEGWMPTLLYATLGALLLVSLLAFMEPATRGGCHLWSSFLGAWYVAHVTVDAFASRSLDRLSGWRFDQAVLPVLAAVGVLVAMTAGAQLLGILRHARVRN